MVVGLLASIYANAYAANWDEIYSGPPGSIWVDRSTISEEHPLVHAWLRMKLSKPDNPGDVTYDERSVHLIFDCESWQYRETSDSKWLHGKLVKQWEGETDYIAIDSDKPLAQAAKALCHKAYGSTHILDSLES
ncbi:hypothetical protein E1N52_19515 [Paraburkholderia guartelaensis]|uniref:Surface-adhesin protein E-like domain-containing protein n=1 Tax=Paraburkholderia guartelaensis TaxID=2546446 RepID=A0A4R5LE90_9BURK|nr:surface-adhesin E family protein [Paraburkholderia guartelaensis]TDG06521.1 hypothetical protein E1N52_19515 [Paraburkholderia guartelaensis]